MSSRLRRRMEARKQFLKFMFDHGDDIIDMVELIGKFVS